MKKLGVFLALALLAQGALADKSAPAFINLAGLMIQSGVSISLAAEEVAVEENTAKTLEQHVQEANRKLEREMEERFMGELYSYAAE